jgi:GxxExxY protein
MHDDLIEKKLSESVIGAFFEVYNELRFGFLEGIYLKALERELLGRGHNIVRQFGAPVVYKGEVIGVQRLDMVVDDKLVVEAKSSENLPPTAIRQLDSYLKATRLEIGLVLHFGPKARFYRRVFRNDN